MPADPKLVRDLFLAADELPAADRVMYLTEHCGHDAELRAAVERLLAAHEHPASVLNRPAPGIPTADYKPITERPGTVIGPYKLLEQIGEGGFGIVFMAEQQQPVRRKVALKVVKPGMDTRQVVARFEAERQALALMDHPNIAHVFDGGETASGRPYFVMELVRGIPITEFCDQEHFRVRERLELFVTVCQAVQHAHQKGIIHRDLKPSNILVTLHDDKAVVKVIDFGIAKATGQQLTEKTLFTNFAQLIGTPLYMSPEQARMSGLDIDTCSDIYALGVLLYELLTGTTPFDKERLQAAAYEEILRIIREEEPAKPSTRISTLGQAATGMSARRQSDPRRLTQLCRGELDWIVMKALEKDRNRRYESASTFAADVQRYLHDEPVQACPPSAGYRFRKFARRNKRVVVMACFGCVAALALAVAAVAVFYNGKLQQSFEETDRARQTAEAQERRASSALDEARFHQYFHYIARANAGWRDGSMGGVEQLLEACPAVQRHWEWDYLKRQCHADLLTLKGHTNRVISVTFSPDGTRLASASSDGTVMIWDATTGREIRTLKVHLELGHYRQCLSTAFSPDGRRLASGGSDGTVRVWDATTGQETLTLRAHDNFCWSATFSPDGTRLASGGSVWDTTTGQEIIALWKTKGGGGTVLFSPDGTRLASLEGDGTVWVWDATTARKALLKIRTGHTGWVLGVAFSPDWTRLATAGLDRTVKVFDATTGREALTLTGHTGGVFGAAFSPDGTRLATYSQDQSVKIWDAATGKEVGTLKGHTHQVRSVAFSPDGTRLASASWDGTVKIWDAATSSDARTLSGHTGKVFSVAFSPDGKCCASASEDRTVRVWDTRTGRVIHTLPGHRNMVTGLAFSPDGKRLASATGAFPGPADLEVKAIEVKVWDVTTGREICSLLKEHPSVFHTVAFSPDGTRLAAGNHDKTTKVWDVATGQEALTLRGHTTAVCCVAFSPDGKRLATADFDGAVKIWEASTGQENRTIGTDTNSPGAIKCLMFSPDGSLLASGSTDGMAKLWDVGTGQVTHTLRGHTDQVYGWAFSPDGKRLASASSDGTVKLWDVATGQEALTLPGHTDAVLSVAFSPDGKQLATGGREGTVKLWDARPWTPEEGTVEREALGLLDFLFAKPLRQADVVNYLLRHSPTLRSQTRQVALSLVDRYREETDPERYHQASWALVRQPYLNALQYGCALWQAQAACELAPHKAKYQTAFGMAQYRLGRYKEALATFTQADQKGGDIPTHLAFLAMTQHQLGQPEQAQATLARFQKTLSQPDLIQNEDLQAFRREAENLMSAKPALPKK
jgi:WD40 repeat protein/serine/threonine protein kinase